MSGQSEEACSSLARALSSARADIARGEYLFGIASYKRAVDLARGVDPMVAGSDLVGADPSEDPKVGETLADNGGPEASGGQWSESWAPGRENSDTTPSVLGQCLVELGEAYLAAGYALAAVSPLTEAAHIFSESKELVLHTRSLTALARACVDCGEISAALDTHQKAVNAEPRDARHRERQALHLTELGDHLRGRGKYADALLLYNQAGELSLLREDRLAGSLRIQAARGECLVELGMNDEAIETLEVFQRATGAQVQALPSSVRSRALRFLARAQRTCGQIKESVESLRQSARALDGCTDVEKFEVFSRLGDWLVEAGDLTSAQDSYTRAAAVYERRERRVSLDVPLVLEKAGECALTTGATDPARELFEEALGLIPFPYTQEGLAAEARVELRLAQLALDNSEFSRALAYAQDAATTLGATKSPWEAFALLLVARAGAASGGKLVAVEMYERAILAFSAQIEDSSVEVPASGLNAPSPEEVRRGLAAAEQEAGALVGQILDAEDFGGV